VIVRSRSLSGTRSTSPLRLQVSNIEPVITRDMQIAFGHDPKCADDGERSRLGAVERVVPIPVVDQLSFRAARQVQVAQEHIALVVACPAVIALSRLTVAFLTPVVMTSVLVDRLVTNRDEVILTRESQPLILAVTDAVVALARLEVTRIENHLTSQSRLNGCNSHKPKQLKPEKADQSRPRKIGVGCPSSTRIEPSCSHLRPSDLQILARVCGMRR